MEQVVNIQNLLKVMSFIKDNWSYIPLILLAISYIKNKSWNKLYELAEKEVIKFAEIPKDDLSNDDKHSGTVAVMNTSILSKMFSQKDLDDIVATARKMTK